MKMPVFLFALTIVGSSTVFAKTIHYDLNIEQKEIDITGDHPVDFALTVNGGIPAPTLVFTEGDEAEIVVHNLTQEETSVHWHGLLLPSEMDGVPYVSNLPILPGKSFTFKFPIRQNGTYWYHSHTHTQEQRGVYGAFVIHPRAIDKTAAKNEKMDADTVLLFSDWTNENPDRVEKNLHKDGGYYLYKKGTMTSWTGALAAYNSETPAISNYFMSEWTRMGAMDFSDVGYDAFLVKFNSFGIRQWGTYYGGSGWDDGYSCTLDHVGGSIYLTGKTTSSSSISPFKSSYRIFPLNDSQ